MSRNTNGLKANIKESFTAANSFPIKLFHDKKTIECIIEKKYIPLRHLQLSPTNKCNLNCSFCSCSKRDKKIELPLRKIIRLLKDAKSLRCKGITITGGGEPILHKHFAEIVDMCYFLNIKVGLVTNGIALNTLSEDTLSKITWCRISFTDERKFDKKYQDNLRGAIKKGENIDWAFSYVATKNSDLLKIYEVIYFANKHNFTHVRLVADLFEPEKVDMEEIHKFISTEIDDSKVIYQARKEFTKGKKDCWISLLKPTIDASGYITPCCGVQYAEKVPSRDFGERMRMGHIKDIRKIWKKQAKFDGRICAKCYYSSYNDVLDILLNNIEHKEFI